MARPKLGNRRLLPIELARESVDLAATGQGELRDMLLKQPVIRVRPARCGPAVLPALRPLGVGQPLGACRDLALDDAEMALRLGLRGFHALSRRRRSGGSIITPPPVDDKRKAASGV